MARDVRTSTDAKEQATRDARMMVLELPRMRRFALFLTHDKDWADDLVQDSLVKAIIHFETWKPGTNLRGWLFTIVKNEFLTDVRRRSHFSALTETHLADERPFANGSSPDAMSELRDVARAFDRLPQRFREVLLLTGIEDLTYDEAATIIGVPVGTVRSRVSRAREAMRNELDSAALPRSPRVDDHYDRQGVV
jgi:RNA polymerase sigma-70 factor, ECF subfamily